MNFMETEIAKLQRRVKQIEENPDPTKLQSTRVLYELSIEARQQQLDAWKTGKPTCFGLNAPALVRAMGFEHLTIVGDADRVVDAEKYFQVLRAHNYPDHHCDRTIIGIGLVLAGDLPIPTMSVSVNTACDPEMMMGHVIGAHLSPHYYCIDIDAKHDDPDERLLRHITEQLEGFIEFAEAKVPGIKLDQDLLKELTAADEEGMGYLRETYELRKQVPCPISGQDVFRLPRRPSDFPSHWKAVEYYRMMRDELGEKAAKGIGAVKEEKCRIMWTITAPYFSNVFKILEDKGASVVHFYVGAASRNFGGKGAYGDSNEFGRPLTLLEEHARMLTLNSWSGLSKRWVDDMEYFCRDLSVDGIVNFEQTGCVAAVLSRQVVADRIKAEMGIPVIFIEGRNMDKSSFNPARMKEQLELFVETCIDAKAQRQKGA